MSLECHYMQNIVYGEVQDQEGVRLELSELDWIGTGCFRGILGVVQDKGQFLFHVKMKVMILSYNLFGVQR